MQLSRADKERINDSRLKIQAAASTLSDVSPSKIPDLDEIQECLENAEKNLAHGFHRTACVRPSNATNRPAIRCSPLPSLS